MNSQVNRFEWSVLALPRVLALSILLWQGLLLNGCAGKVSNLAASVAGVAPIQIATEELNGIRVGDNAFQISTTGGIPPLKYTVVAGDLPTGLTLDSTTGMITGQVPPEAANETFAMTISVSDATGIAAMKTYTVTVDPGNALLSIASSTLSDFIAGISYSYPTVVVGGTKPYIFSVTNGFLPSGINLDPASGLISGTPAATTANQAFAFVLTVVDATGQTATKLFIGTVKPSTASQFSIITQSIPTPAAGASYGASIGVTGGTAPYTFVIGSGSLPTGLSINAGSGLISGTVALSAQGSAYLFSVRASDSTGLVSTVSYSGFVSSYTTTMFPSSLPSATPGQAYNATIATLNGQAPFTYAVTSGGLPAGLAINSSSGAISGTVSQGEAGLTKTFTVRSTDTNGIQSSSSYSIQTAPFPVTITTSSLTPAVEGAAYSNGGISIAASGGSAPYSFEYTGALPSGVGFTSTGSFFGTPASGTGSLPSGTPYTIYVRARDAQNNQSAQVAFTLTVTISAPAVTSASAPGAILGNTYSHAFAATGGRAPYTYAITAGSLPTGLSMNSSGLVSGFPTVVATCPAATFQVRATDVLGQVSAGSSKCIPATNGVIFSTQTLPPVVIGANYSATLAASGGTLPYTFSAVGLPAGISLNASTGSLTGYTNAPVGDSTVFFTASDSSSPVVSSTRSFTMFVRTQLSLSASTLPRAATLVPYANGSGYQITASGGQTPYSFSITSGSLPSGLTLSSSGLLSGAPSFDATRNGGSYTFNVVASDALGQATSPTQFTLNVGPAPKIVGSVLPPAAQGRAYVYDLKRTGGVNQFNGTSTASRLTWTVSGLTGTGLQLSSKGRIYGTPTGAVGSYPLTATLTDQHGITVSKSLTLNIVAAGGKNLALGAPRLSEPCTGSATTCPPVYFDIDKVTNTAQQFLVTARNDLTPKAIQIAKLDKDGRVPIASSNVTSIRVDLGANVSSVNHIHIADMDQDGAKDIVFSDWFARQICIAFNGNVNPSIAYNVASNPVAVDSFGMPTSFSVTNTLCYPITTSVTTNTNQGANQFGGPFAFQIRTDLRPDSFNNGKADIVVSNSYPSTSNSGIPATVYILKNTCPPGGVCTGSSVSSQSATLTNNSNTFNLGSTSGLYVGMSIYGNNIPAGAKISGISGSTITMSTTATASGATTVFYGARPMLFEGFMAVSATTVNASTSVSIPSGIPLSASRHVVGLGIPVVSGNFYAATISSVAATSFVLSHAATRGGTTIITTPIARDVTGLTIAAATNVIHITDSRGIYAGQQVSHANYGGGTYLAELTRESTITGLTLNPLSATVNVANTSGLVVGQQVTHANFPAGTTISAINPDVSITMSANSTNGGTLSGHSLTFPARARLSQSSSNGAQITGQSVRFWGPSSHTPLLIGASNSGMSQVHNIGTGWFVRAKPASIPGGVSSADACPGIAVAGFQASNTANGWVYVMRQSYSGGECQGDFTQHTSTDEWLAFGGTPWLSGIATSDFTGDGVSDIVVTSGAAQTNSAVVRTYVPMGQGTGVFASGTNRLSQLQSRGTNTTGASKVVPYCLDGSATCTYPAIAVTCGRDGYVGNPGYTWGCLAIFPNQCTASDCTMPFEIGVPAVRIDYPANQGQFQDPIAVPLVSNSTISITASAASGSSELTDASSLIGIQVGQAISGQCIPAYSFVTGISGSTISINQQATGSCTAFTLPAIPTRNDIAVSGQDSISSSPYFSVYARNGESTSDPLRSLSALDGYPASYLLDVDIATTRIGDGNGDGIPDLYGFSPLKGIVNSYISSNSGGREFSVKASVPMSYINNPSLAGCPDEATSCFPDPILNPMGVQQGYPNTWTNQNVMDTGDLNNDDIPDIAVNGYSSAGISVAVGNASGDFNAPVLYDLSSTTGSELRPQSLTFSDLDQDGFLDLAVVGFNQTANNGFGAWLKGNGDGTFQNPILINQIVSTCTDPRSISPVDLDLDGRPEIAVLCYTSQAIFISRRHTDGTWVLQSGATINSAGGANGVAMRWGRLTSDSATGIDVAVVGVDATNSLRIINDVGLTITNASIGAFTVSSSPTPYISLLGAPSDVEFADLNADGYGDLVVTMQRNIGTNYWTDNFVTCTSSGAGVCDRQGWLSGGYTANAVSIDDLNADGLPDLLVSHRGSRLIFRSISRILNLSY
jgi:hypothetical protein